MNTDALISQLTDAHDQVWARYKRIIERARAECAYSRLMDEVTRLHQSRTCRTLLVSSQITADDLIRANLEDMSHRSRLVEIKVNNSRVHRRLSIALDTTASHITHNCSALLTGVGVGKTKTERASFVELVLADGWGLLEKIDKIDYAASQVIDDIDKGSWNYRNLVQLLSLTMQRENIVSSARI